MNDKNTKMLERLLAMSDDALSEQDTDVQLIMRYYRDYAIELKEENKRLKESNEHRRQYEVQVREQAVWESNFRKNKREDYSSWTVGVLTEIHRSVLRCNEQLGDDGLCECMRHIGAILQHKHDDMKLLARNSRVSKTKENAMEPTTLDEWIERFEADHDESALANLIKEVAEGLRTITTFRCDTPTACGRGENAVCNSCWARRFANDVLNRTKESYNDLLGPFGMREGVKG